MGTLLRYLDGIQQTIGTMCDSKAYGGNENKEIDKGREKALYDIAVKSIKNNTFVFQGTTYNADGSVFNYVDAKNTQYSFVQPQTFQKYMDDYRKKIEFLPIITKTDANGFSNQYDDKILKYAEKYNLEPNMVKAIMKTESGFNKNATSSAKCQGLMQVNPKYNKGNLYDPDTNIDAGCRIYRECLDSFNGDRTKALMGYNQGISGAKKSIKRGVNQTTYTKKVLENYQALQQNKQIGIIA